MLRRRWKAVSAFNEEERVGSTRERAERAGDDPGRKMDADAVAKMVARRRRSVGFVMVVWLWLMPTVALMWIIHREPFTM